MSALGLVGAALWAKAIPLALIGSLLGALSHSATWLRVLAVPAAFLAFEALHSLAPWGVPWVFLGHSQAPVSGIAQLAAIGGVPLVSAVVALVNSLIVELLRSGAPSPRLLAPLCASVGAIVALGLSGVAVVERAQPRTEEMGEILILAVQPSIPREERWVPDVQRSHLLSSLSLASHALAGLHERPDLVVLPETLVTSPIEGDPRLSADLRHFAETERVRAVAGVARVPYSGRPERYRNSVVVADPDGRLLAGIDKTLAVPFIEGEPPELLRRLRAALGGEEAGPRVETSSSAGPLRIADRTFAVLLCYELLFPGLVASRRAPDTTAILDLANDSWFEGDSLTGQTLAIASFRAIEQRLPVVRIAQGGSSAVIDPYGRVLATLPVGSWGTLVARTRGGPAPGLSERAMLLAVCFVGAAIGAFAALGIQRRFRVMRIAITGSVGLLALLLAAPASSQSIVGTLRLDGLSYISFEGRETFSLPAGSTIRFRFAKASNGALAFSIQPSDVSIAPIPIGDGATLTYALAAPSSGTVRRGANGQAVIRFGASISATLAGTESPGSQTYALEFTTESASAKSADGARTVEIQGMRVVDGPGYVQLVGAATNKPDAVPEPGAAVTAVLSGTFDQLPSLR